MTHTGIQAEDLFKLKSVSDPQLSPDGNKVIFVQTSIEEETESYVSHLFMYNIENTSLEQWTFGNHRDSSPRWSPDGSQIAFLSNRSGKNQIHLLNPLGGESRKLTDLEHGSTMPIWSPCSQKILISSALKEGKFSEKDTNSRKNQSRREPSKYEHISYKSDSSGYSNCLYHQIAIVDVGTSRIEFLTGDKQDFHPASWSPDGTSIAYTSSTPEEADYYFFQDVFIMDIHKRTVEAVTKSDGYFRDPKWSPDSRFLSFIGHKKEFANATHSKIWLYDTSSHSVMNLTEGWDVQIGDAAISDFHIGAVDPGILWTLDSAGFYFIMSDRGNTGVYYGSIEGAMYPSLLEDQHIYGLTIDPLHHKAVLAISKPELPGELFSYSLMTGEIQQITFINDLLLKNRTIAKAETFTYSAEDGREIHGWLMKPADFLETESYPLILEIHGGPHAMYANTYYHEFQALASCGYTILYTNPRGSYGYGQDFAQACCGDYGGNDYKDLMAAVDFAVHTHPWIDTEKLAVTGGSYGGFMTNWIVGHTDRFKAAATQRCISNWISFYGFSDIGYYFTEWEMKADIFTSPEELWNRSPLKYAAQVQTPLLLLHGEKDYRCPIEQSEQFFIAL